MRIGEDSLRPHELSLGKLLNTLMGSIPKQEYYIGTPINRTPEIPFLKDTDRIYRSPNLPRRKTTGVHEKLYQEASTRKARREEKECIHNREKIEKEEQQLNAVRIALRASAKLCRDTRNSHKRNLDHLRKRSLTIIKGLEEKRKRDEAELRECTFSPKLISRAKPTKFNPSVCFNPRHLTRPPVGLSTVALSGLESTSTIDAFI